MVELAGVTLALSVLAGVTLALSVLAGVTLALLLESHVQMIELAGVILALSMGVLVGVNLAHPFEDGSAWVCSSWGIKEVTSPRRVYAVRSVGSYLKGRGMQMLKQEVRRQQQEQEVKDQEVKEIRSGIQIRRS